ncbi:MAG: hypothetical protein ABSB42_07860 [Tepidisphaeraceae bacterium]
MSALETWHSIIDAEAAFHDEHGHPPKKLKLPVRLAYQLAKLPRDQFELSELIAKEGIDVIEEKGLLGVSVEIMRDGSTQFSFE